MYFVFDTETSGLPTFTKWRGYFDPRDLSKYNSSRIVQISWRILDQALELIEKQTYVIKPDNFIIPQSSIDIHHITNEKAHQEGVPLSQVLDEVRTKCPLMKMIVAHNVYFDVNVLKSECHRYGYDDIAKSIDKANKYCTMAKAKEKLNLSKNPKLSELYNILCNEQMKNAHDAEFDTYYCCQCFEALMFIPNTDPEVSIAKLNDAAKAKNQRLKKRTNEPIASGQ